MGQNKNKKEVNFTLGLEETISEVHYSIQVVARHASTAKWLADSLRLRGFTATTTSSSINHVNVNAQALILVLTNNDSKDESHNYAIADAALIAKKPVVFLYETAPEMGGGGLVLGLDLEVKENKKLDIDKLKLDLEKVTKMNIPESIVSNLKQSIAIPIIREEPGRSRMLDEIIHRSGLSSRIGVKNVRGEIVGVAKLKVVEYEPGTRQWVFDTLYQWYQDEDQHWGNRVFALLGEEGVGKSVVCAELCRQSLNMDGPVRVAANHFFSNDEAETLQLESCFRSISEQLAMNIDGFPETSENLRTRKDGKLNKTLQLGQIFTNLILVPIKALTSRQPDCRCVVVIDGIDELESNEREILLNIIEKYWIPKLPAWLGLIFSCRSSDFVLNRSTNSRFKYFELEASDVENRLDIAQYVQRRIKAPSSNLPRETEVANAVLDLTKGIFMYVRLLGLQSGETRQDELLAFSHKNNSAEKSMNSQKPPPVSFDLLISNCFARIKKSIGSELYLILFETLVASRGPLAVSTLADICGISWFDFQTQIFRQLVAMDENVLLMGDDHVKFSHRKIREWIKGTPGDKTTGGGVSRQSGHKRLADWCSENLNSLFAERNYVYHLCNCGSVDHIVMARDLLLDFNFLKQRVSSKRGITELLSDFDCFLCVANKEIEGVNDIKTLMHAVRLSSNALSDDPRQLAAQLIGRINKKGMKTVEEACHFMPSVPWLFPVNVRLLQADSFGDNESIFSNRKIIKCGFERVLCASLSRNGKKGASCSVSDFTVEIWDTQSGDQIRLIKYESTVTCLCLSGDGQSVATGLQNGAVCINNTASGVLIRQLLGHTSIIRDLVFTFGDKFLLSGSADKTARLWDCEAGEAVTSVLNQHADEITCVAVADNNANPKEKQKHKLNHYGCYKIATGTRDGCILVHDVASPFKVVLQVNEHLGPVTSLSFSPDAKSLASSSLDRTLRLWNIKSGNCIWSCKLKMGHVNDLSFTSSGNHIVTASSNKILALWNGKNGSLVLKINDAHDSSINSLAVGISEDKIECEHYAYDIVFTASDDCSLRLWEVDVTEKTGKRWSMSSRPRSSRFSKSLKAKANVATDTVTYGHKDIITAFEFSENGRLVTGSTDNTVIVWDIEKGAILHIFKGHSGPINFVSFSPDGTKIVSASQDQFVRVWNLDTNQCDRYYEMPGSEAVKARFSSSGRKIVAENRYRDLVIWDVNTMDRLPWDMSKRYKIYEPNANGKSRVRQRISNDDADIISFTPDTNLILGRFVYSLSDFEMEIVFERENVHFLKWMK